MQKNDEKVGKRKENCKQREKVRKRDREGDKLSGIRGEIIPKNEEDRVCLSMERQLN